MKKRLLLFFAATLAGLAGNVAWTQQLLCATDHYHRQMIQQDPTLAKDLEQLIANSYLSKSDGDDSTVFVIPVVFHIIHQNGIENISDAQVIDAMTVLNRDFRKQNPDTILVISEFDTLVADIKIEFRLASYDPWGNCTNGIDRIYSHETSIGDNSCKLNQWDRSRYLNIWVVQSMESGTAGYAYYPTSVNGLLYWIDGIVIRHNYVGRIGTGSEATSRTLTHEVGHWLALPHVWGSTNEPGVACGDDGINDTPITMGYTSCPSNPSAAIICDTAGIIVENYQNYMEYSFCRHMFTLGQAAVMRFVLQNNDGQRKTLITEATHQSTGIDLTTPPVCVPTADIRSNRKFVCIGQSVTFTDQSFNGPVTFREWTFQDGSPATSTDANPTVTFNSFGPKNVTLTVGNASGQVTKVFEKFIDVQHEGAAYSGPKMFDLESPTQYQELRIVNDGDNYSKFEPYPVGYNSGRSLKLTTYKDISDALTGSPESRYYEGLGGQVDAIITPAFDLRYMSGVTFSFDYSYATNAVLTSMMSENIRVYYARDCGEIWMPLGTTNQSTISGATLASAGFAGSIDFVPASLNDWGSFSRPFNANSTDNRTRFKIEFTSSDYSSNLFIDNIMISGTLGLVDDFTSEHELIISPNPVVGGNNLNIQYVAGSDPVTFTLRNLQGEAITSVERNEVNQSVSFGLEISENVAAAYYFLEVRSANGVTVKKIAVIK